MIRDCIPKEAGEKLKAVIQSGEVSVDDLKAMPSRERTKFFAKYIDEHLAKKLNIGFEERLNSKTVGILEKYLERELTAVPRKIKKSLTDKIAGMKKLLKPDAVDENGNPLNEVTQQFADELVAHKIGAYIEPEVAERLLKLAEKAQSLREKISDTTTELKFGATGNVKPIKGRNIKELQKIAEERLTFGRADFDVKHYMESVIKQKAEKKPAPDGFIPKTAFYTKKTLAAGASLTKAIKATLDNSVFGRQGWKLLLMEPEAWRKNFVKSWVDIGKTFVDKKADRVLLDASGKPTEFFYENVLRETHAEIVSRPNSLRGAYRAARNEYGLGVSAEELFPHLFDYTKGDWREKALGNAVINPIIRTHKGFENAFSAGALRMRADFADALIRHVEKTNGINVMDKDVANALGTFVSSVTGRGELGKFGAIGGELNTVLFSPRFFKSQIDTILHPYQLAAHTGVFSNIPKEVRRTIGKKYVRYLGTNGSLLAILQLMGLTDLDPRSDAFGYLVVGERKYDLTGGQRGLFALAAKMATTKRKNFTTGVVYDVADRFGYDKGEDIANFIEGKSAPLAGTIWRLMSSGTNFDGYEIRPTSLQNTKNLINELFIPITLDQGISMFSYKEPSWIQGLIGEFLGVNNRTQVSRPNSGKWGDLLNSNQDAYEKAVDEYNAKLWKLVRKNSHSVRIKKMSEKELADYYDKEIKKIKRDTVNKYLSKSNNQ